MVSVNPNQSEKGMKPQLDKIRAEAEANWENQIRLSEIIEKLLRVIECQDDAAEEAIARLGDFGDLYSSRPLRLAQAEVLRILEGS